MKHLLKDTIKIRAFVGWKASSGYYNMSTIVSERSGM